MNNSGNAEKCNGKHSAIEQLTIGYAAMGILANLDSPAQGYQAYLDLCDAEEDDIPEHINPCSQYDFLSATQVAEEIESIKDLFSAFSQDLLHATKRTLIDMAIDARLDSDVNTWDLQYCAEQGLNAEAE
ncbi:MULTISPECIES: hypothetical protein [Aeromonas]|uniref:Uncharacterized protein n=1 Tax=Aeromonas veronii TaxID=654 RepID=A0A4S5CJX6_AERVE|nr:MULTISPECIES: hypothetical protein [Aeromonas]THJ44951.1 hypothetical protein E8Q35_12235 [Aeromonas veronii]